MSTQGRCAYGASWTRVGHARRMPHDVALLSSTQKLTVEYNFAAGMRLVNLDPPSGGGLPVNVDL